MIINNGQRLKATVEFYYDAPVFDEDPDDVYELARLEELDLDANPDAIGDLIAESTNVSIKIEPALGDQ